MHFLFRLMTLIALTIAPLVAPVAAMAAVPVAAECGDMAMTDHEMPAADHGAGEPCCIAVPPAIDPPINSIGTIARPAHLAFVALTEPLRLGAGPHAEDPPPRIA